MGGAIRGDGKEQRKKRKGNGIHTTRGPLQLSAVVAPMVAWVIITDSQ